MAFVGLGLLLTVLGFNNSGLAEDALQPVPLSESTGVASAQAPVSVPTPAVSLTDTLYLIGQSLFYILEAFILFWFAKLAYSKLYRRVDLNAELFTRDNQAVAISTVGYYFGILLAFGGAVSGESQGLRVDVVTIAIYGFASIILMLLASFMCEKVLLPAFNNTKEIVEDKNLGVAFVEAGVYIANGLIILRVSQGDVQGAPPSALLTLSAVGYSILVLIVFWLLAQVVLIIAGRLYDLMTSYKIHEQLERDNAAVGLAFGGALIGIGNIVSVATRGDFTGWKDSLSLFGADAAFGFIMLFLVHKLTDALLAPGVTLADEQIQENPNIGAGLLEAFGYVGASMLIVWAA
ncbi:DUF350 domain-containing protein [Acidobacteria bacterium AH-259-O06]|nr:DUF350 domain-containing protein [Acidobacteria bacterium AH-259-G07]MDA2930935.1 DUF350 domain-containing protein [Acidobacteria bacterium AH-259-O06]